MRRFSLLATTLFVGLEIARSGEELRWAGGVKADPTVCVSLYSEVLRLFTYPGGAGATVVATVVEVLRSDFLRHEKMSCQLLADADAAAHMLMAEVGYGGWPRWILFQSRSVSHLSLSRH